MENYTTTEPVVRKWLRELSDAYKREKNWRRDAKRLVEMFECENRRQTLYNILYANTETLSPALYNTTPRPDVRRRFKDNDEVARAGGLILQRVLEFLLDNNLQDSPHFDDIVEQAILEALVVGRGVVRFRYNYTGEEQLENEGISAELVAWQRFRHSYAKQWKDVSWIAFQHFMTRDQLLENFGEDGKAVALDISSTDADNSAEDDGYNTGEGDEGQTYLGMVWEIWDKTNKQVLFISNDKVLRQIDDPLKLSGFFPIPEPLTFFPKISSLEPVPLYASYEGQARELNKITLRIARIIEALKVRGFYDSTVGGLDRVLEAEDNELIAAENIVAMQQGQTLEKSIWLMPLNELVLVLQQLYTQRDQIKNIIYEITGISDIVRGSSSAYETATAQQYKNQWGSLRLRRLQKRVAMFVRECLRVMAEIASKLQPETIIKMTGLKYPRQAEQIQAQQMLPMLQQQAQQQPQLQQQIQQAQRILNQPSWEQIMELLANNTIRNYRIDIEANSTIDPENAENNQKLSEFLNAFAQFINGVAPMVAQGYLPIDAGREILLAITRRYRFGEDVEDSLKQISMPQQQGGNQEAQQKQQQLQAKAQQEAQKGQVDLALKNLELQQKQQEAQLNLAIKQQEVQAKQQEIQMKSELNRLQAQNKLSQMAMKQQQAMAEQEYSTLPATSSAKSQHIIDPSNWRTGKGGAVSAV